MKTITRAELQALGGAPDALFAVLHADGTLYFSTTAPEAERDEYRWRDMEDRQMEMKRVVP